MNRPLLLVLFAAALLSFLLQLDESEAQGGKKTVKVHANKFLNDAKLYVQAGDIVSFEAKGEWTVKPKKGVFCGPEGEPGTSAPKGYQLPGAPIGALVANVMGKRYLVGSGAKLTFDTSGPVQLTANAQSKLSAYLGNKGVLTVRIEVRKVAAADINGRYEVTFKEDQVVVTSGGTKKVVSLGELKRQKVQAQGGEDIQLPENTAETLKDLSRVIDLKVVKAQVIIREPQKPKQPPKKGIYDANKKEFLVHVKGSLKQVIGTCYFAHAKNITGKLAPGPQGPALEGSVNLTLTLFCTGSQTQKGKGKAVTVSVPFVGTRLPQ